jgi:iron complex transport system ATP-binding protein
MTSGTAVLELREVEFRRDGKQILQAVTFTVRQGEQWALLGPNGAGKTTILGMCGAETHPTSGTVHVLGERLGRVDMAQLRRVIGHVNPRHPLRAPLTLREVVLTGITGTIEVPYRWQPEAADTERVDSLIEDLGLGRRAADRWPTLSQGERGRALIARALVCRPRLLLLDEPSTGLDVAAREQLLETVDTLVTAHPELASILVTPSPRGAADHHQPRLVDLRRAGGRAGAGHLGDHYGVDLDGVRPRDRGAPRRRSVDRARRAQRLINCGCPR